MRVSQRFCNILVTWVTIQPLWLLLRRSWRWPTILDWAIPNSPDTLWVLLDRFVNSLYCYVLTFWPGQKCHSRWCTGRKWHILMAVMRGNGVGGNWLMKWDEVIKIPLYYHRLMHRKRVTSEWLHDSYFRLMTIKHSISKIAWAIKWALNYYIAQSRQKSSSRVGGGDRRDVVGTASTQQSGLQDSGWVALENEKDTTLTAITLGSKYFIYVRSQAPSHTQTLSNPFVPLQIKWEVYIFLKKSSCVCLFIVSLWCCRWAYNSIFRVICVVKVFSDNCKITTFYQNVFNG